MVKKIVIHHEEIQIVFKSDPELKDAALEKAKHEGMTLKAVLCSAMRAYVNDEMVMGMTRREDHYETDDDELPKEKAPPRATGRCCCKGSRRRVGSRALRAGRIP